MEQTNNLILNLQRYRSHIDASMLVREIGKVTHVTGFLMRGYLPGAAVGSMCRVYSTLSKKELLTEVIGFSDKNVLLMPLGEMDGIGLGSKIVLEKPMATIRVGKELLGRVRNLSKCKGPSRPYPYCRPFGNRRAGY